MKGLVKFSLRCLQELLCNCRKVFFSTYLYKVKQVIQQQGVHVLLQNNNHFDSKNDVSFHSLRADCESCFGLCCVALPFAVSADFAVNKDAGKPCSNLQSDFRCSTHKNLRKSGFKGCTVFECFGAGQKVSQVTFEGVDWREGPEHAKKMYDVFPIMHQLHEMLWYLNEALTLKVTSLIYGEIRDAIEETERLSRLSPDLLMKINVPLHRADVNTLLLRTSELVWMESRHEYKGSKKIRDLTTEERILWGQTLKSKFEGSEFKRGIPHCC